MQSLTATYSTALDWLKGARSDPLTGSYLEFGVCAGSSMIAMADTLKSHPTVSLAMVGFDSFQGLPEGASSEDGGVWQDGDFMADEERTEQRLREHGIEPELVVGWFSDTLNNETKAKLSLHSAPLIMVDCDLYSATVQALEFCVPLITGPTVIVFDDWNSGSLATKGLGEAKAWKEFRTAHPEIIEIADFPAYNTNSRVIGVDLAVER